MFSLPPAHPQDASGGKIAEAKGQDSLVKEVELSLAFNLSDDQPLSMWLGSQAANATCKLVYILIALVRVNRVF